MAACDSAGGQWEDPEQDYQEWCVERVGTALGAATFEECMSRGAPTADAVVSELVRRSPTSGGAAGTSPRAAGEVAP